jgi:hypothetical protein
MVLLREGSDPNASNNAGNTSLHLCARIRNVSIARALLSCGAKLGLQNGSKETPLSAAKLYKNADVTKYFESISNRSQRRDSFNAVLRRYMAELANEDDLDEDSEKPPAKSAGDKAIVQRIYAQTKAIQVTVQKFDEMGLFDDLPPLGQPTEKLEVPDGLSNRAFASFCAEIDRLYEKVMRVAQSRNITEHKVVEVPPDKANPSGPLQMPYTLVPVNIFPKSVLCTICGTQAITQCRECDLPYCRICHYSSLHTCEAKL